MGKKIYVGNLGPDADEESLKALFTIFGKVEKAYIIRDKQTKKSKGYAFVEMSNEAEAKAAIEALDGKDCGGYTVKVNEAKGK